MRVLGQDSDGRLIIDLEGEVFTLNRGIPMDSPAIISNGVFYTSESEVVGNSQELELVDTYVHDLINLVSSDKDISKPKVVEEVDPILTRWEILDIR